MILDQPAAEAENLEYTRCSSSDTSDNFTIFEGQAVEVKAQRGHCATEGC